MPEQLDLNFATEVRLGEQAVSEILTSDQKYLWKTGEWPTRLDFNVFFRREMAVYPAYARSDGVEISGIQGTWAVWNGKWLRICDDNYNLVEAVVDATASGGGQLQGVKFGLKVSGAWRYAHEDNGRLVQVFNDDLTAYPWPVTTLFEFQPFSLESLYQGQTSTTFIWREYEEIWNPETQLPEERTIYSGIGTARYIAR